MDDDSIYLLKDSGDLEKVRKQSYDSEELLQVLIEKYPELLAGEQINPDEPIRWILIKREAGVPDGEELGNRWSVDHLLLDHNGVPTFVETKRSSDTRIRREMIGQMLDYAANSLKYWSVKRIRVMTNAQYEGMEGADAAILEFLGTGPEEDTSSVVESYWSKVEANLHSGQVRLVFVADQLPRELRRIIEFLNEHMDKVEVLGIELPQFVGSDFRALVPRLIGQTESIRQRKQETKPTSRRTTMTEFLSGIPEEFEPLFQGIFLEAEKRGMQIYWGTKGFSLRTIGGAGKMISLFYGYPPGANDRDVTYIQGYVADIKNENLKQDIRERFPSIPGTTLQGNYTYDLVLSEATMESANKLIQIVWDINQELTEAE
jgi:hypothetical protein